MNACRTVFMLSLAASALTVSAEERIAAKADGVEAEVRSDGTIKVVVETRGGASWLSIHDSEQTGTLDCKGRHVSVSGEDNKLKLTGTCLSVEVSGDRNELVVEVLGEASLAGDENRIQWKRAASGNAPAVTDSGDGNSVSRASAG